MILHARSHVGANRSRTERSQYALAVMARRVTRVDTWAAGNGGLTKCDTHSATPSLV
jgi:hypothetical protein